ncbi:transmembrane emp24 domain-containing protein p24beta3 [Tanacetum coccineum]
MVVLSSSKVSSPGGNVVQTMKGTSGEKFEFKAPRSGMYQFCFHNPILDSSRPSLSTSMLVIFPMNMPLQKMVCRTSLIYVFEEAIIQHLDPVNVKIAELREALESVTAKQKYLKAACLLFFDITIQMKAHINELSFTRLENTFCWQSQAHSKWFTYVGCLASQLHTTGSELTLTMALYLSYRLELGNIN